jgi:hypothetical protein
VLVTTLQISHNSHSLIMFCFAQEECRTSFTEVNAACQCHFDSLSVQRERRGVLETRWCALWYSIVHCAIVLPARWFDVPVLLHLFMAHATCLPACVS